MDTQIGQVVLVLGLYKIQPIPIVTSFKHIYMTEQSSNLLTRVYNLDTFLKQQIFYYFNPCDKDELLNEIEAFFRPLRIPCNRLGSYYNIDPRCYSYISEIDDCIIVTRYRHVYISLLPLEYRWLYGSVFYTGTPSITFWKKPDTMKPKKIKHMNKLKVMKQAMNKKRVINVDYRVKIILPVSPIILHICNTP